MKKFQKLVLLGFTKGNLGKSEWDRMAALCEKKVLLPSDSPDITKQLSDTDCLLVKLGASVDASLIDKAPSLRYIGMYGTGYGRIDTRYAATKGITVCNIAGYSTEGVAEFVFAMILERIRDMERAKSQARNGEYSESTFAGYEIQGKVFGVVGLGRIGGRVAHIAHDGFGAHVRYWSRSRKKTAEKSGIRYADLPSVLRQSDFLSVHLAYVPETKNFFTKQKINLIKPGCVVVSTVQNEVFDLDALADRLAKNDITFILDHSDELTPKQAKILTKYDNCILYPPIGYITKEATQLKLGMFVDNLENFLKGKPTNKVN